MTTWLKQIADERLAPCRCVYPAKCFCLPPALAALERARRAQEAHDRRVDVQLRLLLAGLKRGLEEIDRALEHADATGPGVDTDELERARDELSVAIDHLTDEEA